MGVRMQQESLAPALPPKKGVETLAGLWIGSPVTSWAQGLNPGRLESRVFHQIGVGAIAIARPPRGSPRSPEFRVDGDVPLTVEK